MAQVERFSPHDWLDGNGGSGMRQSLNGKYVQWDDYKELLDALKDVMAGTYSARQHEKCTDYNFKRVLAVIAKAEGN